MGTPAAFEGQIVSRQRVADHGEVFTAKREVEAMLHLVQQETERIDARFLEPACGTGNFLAEILARKLRAVERQYGRSQFDYERNAVLAVSSIYGIDILEDSVQQCRRSMFDLFDREYTRLFPGSREERCRSTVTAILERNIIHGDALSLSTVGHAPRPIVFSEWSFLNGTLLKRRDYTFRGLLASCARKEPSLLSDFGQGVFIPAPSREFPPTHFLEVAGHGDA